MEISEGRMERIRKNGKRKKAWKESKEMMEAERKDWYYRKERIKDGNLGKMAGNIGKEKYEA